MDSDKMFEKLGFVKVPRYAGDSYVSEEQDLSIYIKNTKIVEIYSIKRDLGFIELSFEEIKAIQQKIKEMKKDI